ncbi:MAG: hypothetical protein AB7V50_06750 [Vampirovibrionia bacterium]
MIVISSRIRTEVINNLKCHLSRATSKPVFLFSQEELVKDALMSLKTTNNEISTIIKFANGEVLDLNQCTSFYFANYPYILYEWIPYENYLDKLYALQEWSASFTAAFQTHKNIEFINPLLVKYDFVSEAEQILYLQRFKLDTIDQVLTNNPDKALKYYEQWNKQVLFKSVRKGYDTASNMETVDLGRLDKLSLSPVIFQKVISGKEVNVCLLGENCLAVERAFENEIETKNVTEIPLDIKNKLVEISKDLNCPLLQVNFIYNNFDHKYYAFGLDIYPDFEVLYSLFDDELFKMFCQYFIGETA